VLATAPHGDKIAEPLVGPVRDLAAVEQAAATFLTALGIPADTETTRHTATRMASAYAEILSPVAFQPTCFENVKNYRDFILARELPFRSICAHHLMPFVGVADIGYLPGQRLVGLSKLARAMAWCAARPQMQEELTVAVADWVVEHLAPAGVGVMLAATHGCMTLRGACAAGSSVVTIATRGSLVEDRAVRAEFMMLAGAAGGGR